MSSKEAEELRVSLQSAQKDVESKAATIKHLQNALEAKTMTITILSKANKDGKGDSLEKFIIETVEEKCSSRLATKDEELGQLRQQLQALEERPAPPAAAEASSAEAELQELRNQVKDLEGRAAEAETQAAEAETQAAEAEGRAADVFQLRDQVKELEGIVAEAETQAAEAEGRAAEAQGRAAEALAALEQEREKASQQDSQAAAASQQLLQLRDYQAKAIELTNANEALSEQLEGANEEMQQMQADHQQELDEVRKELSLLQGDRETHSRAVVEQIDSRVKAMRNNLEDEKEDLRAKLEDERERNRTQVQDLVAERDRLTLRCDAQELELKALRDSLGAEDGPLSPRRQAEDDSSAAEQKSSGEKEEDKNVSSRAEKVRNLREQSQFAFDEMSRRITEVREEAETERKQLKADMDAELKKRSATVVELTNARDILETQAEALQQSHQSLGAQRDEMARQIREKDREKEVLESDLEALQERERFLKQQLGCLGMVHSLQKSAVLPAFSLVRRSVIGLGDCPVELAKGGTERLDDFAKVERDSTVDNSSTVDGEGTIMEEDDVDDEESEDEPTYGVDDEGEEQWNEMMATKSLEAFFVGADAVAESSKAASQDLEEQIHTIVSSLEFFPQFYGAILQELDGSGRGQGKELRRFLAIIQKAMGRALRIASVIDTLCVRSEGVVSDLKNLVRVKGLEWHLRHLRAAGQAEILMKLQRNQLAKMKEEYQDILEEYGTACEKSADLQSQVDKFESELTEARPELEATKKKCEELTAALEAAKSAAAAPGAGEAAAASPPEAAAEVAAPAPAKAKGKGKKGPGPPPPASGGAAAAADVATPPPAEELVAEEKAAAAEEPTAASAEPAPKAKGKGKGKKGPGPPPPPSGGGAAPAATEAEAPAAAAEEPAAGAPAEPAPKAKGKGKKGPGPPPPPSGGGAAAPAAAEAEAAPAAVPAKGKGKKGPGPPPPGAKGGAAAPDAAAAEGAAAPAPAAGKGPGKGPPAKGGKGPPAAKGAAKGAAGKGGKKGALGMPEVDPGPKPPEDLQPKTFHWTGLIANRFATSMFATIVEDLNSAAKPKEESEEKPAAPKTLRLKMDTSVLTNFFFKRKEEDKQQVKETKKKTVANCLDAKRSQAVEIFLNGCGVTIDHVKGYVLDLDEKAMGVENLGKVLEFYPQGEEVGELKEFQQNNDPKVLPYGRAEDFLLNIMAVPSFKARAECCIAKGMFPAECEEVTNDITTLLQCLSAVTKSTALPNIFALVMQIGNYLNFGNARKGALRGFTLDTLPLLVRVEGFDDKTYTLMRYIMDTLESDRAVKDSAIEDLKLCDAASKLDFDEAVRRLAELDKKVKAVAAHVAPKPKEEGASSSVEVDFDANKITVSPKKDGEEELEPSAIDDANMDRTMRRFAREAQEKIAALQKQVEEVTQLSKLCCDIFAEKPKTPSPETLGKLGAFKKDMEEARRANLLAKVKREKAEKRRAEQEAKAAKAKEKAEAAAPQAASPVPKSSDTAKATGDAATDADKPSSAGTSTSTSSPPKMRKMEISLPDRPELKLKSSSSSVHTSNSGRMSMGAPSLGRQSMGPLGGPSQSQGRQSMGMLTGPAGGRNSLGVSAEMLAHLRASLEGGSSASAALAGAATATVINAGSPEKGRATLSGVPSSAMPEKGRATLGVPTKADMLKISASGRLSLNPKALKAALAQEAEGLASHGKGSDAGVLDAGR